MKATKTKTYYKAVRRGNKEGNFFSAYATGKACLEYEVGKRTRPLPGTGILAFDSMDCATLFVHRNQAPCFVVMKGRGRYRNLGSYCSAPITDLTPCSTTMEDEIKRSWTREDKRFWPEGTVALEWFEPKEIIECPLPKIAPQDCSPRYYKVLLKDKKGQIWSVCSNIATKLP